MPARNMRYRKAYLPEHLKSGVTGKQAKSIGTHQYAPRDKPDDMRYLELIEQ